MANINHRLSCLIDSHPITPETNCGLASALQQRSLSVNRIILTGLIAAGWAFLTAGIATANVIVVPGDLATTEGNSASFLPFNISRVGATRQRYQQVYLASEFGGVSGIIDTIAFRSDRDTPSGFQVFGYGVEIRLAHTPKTPDTLYSDFASNIGTDETLVYNTGIDLRFQVISPSPRATSPQLFVPIDLDDFFIYNGVDNLLLDIRVVKSINSGSDNSAFDAVYYYRNNDPISVMAAVYSGPGDSVGNPTGTVTKRALATQFSIIPVEIPEPSTLAIFALGLAGLGFVRRRRIAYRTGQGRSPLLPR